jgi:hypothetical protein
VKGGRLSDGGGRVGGGRRDAVRDIVGREEGRVGACQRGPRESVEAVLAAVEAYWEQETGLVSEKRRGRGKEENRRTAFCAGEMEGCA